ncbi:hypothetical protein FGADI_6747 [Fusarium gaditjirri]|uniref:Heterokaryon incompatibility domain-containing protein n=1 Tax=Fusarium gaditjirri TaxID=282569 RepID=A0A8H4T799_9HYPO|nr:hypothetical protein FGADI_6747 [Fusarium gaditjirri]
MADKTLNIDYSSLAPTTEIRIFTLQQGISNDPIVCILRSVTRTEAEYYALSYEWGDESKNDPFITVNDRTVQVRANLLDALKSIRKPTEDLQLWVDAICINQSDLKEKSQQVAMMGETFKNAVGIISWLGPTKDDSDLAMDLMSDADDLESKLSSFSKSSRESQALFSLCHRRYWLRVWIIQELYLAKSYVVWCGARSIASDMFEESLAVLNGANSPFYHYRGFEQNPAQEHRLARRLRNNPNDKLNTLWRWLLVCLRNGFQCTKEQDFIYALLDISDDYERMKETLKVDYSKSPRDVFLDLLRQMDLMWHHGYRDGRHWLKLAEKMKLNIDEDLRTEISSRFPG